MPTRLNLLQTQQPRPWLPDAAQRGDGLRAEPKRVQVRVKTQATAPVALRAPVAADAERFVTLAQRSQALHTPWTSAPSTPESFAAYLAQLDTPANQGFLVCRPPKAGEGEQIAGVFNLSQIVMGNFRSAYLG